MMASRGRVVLLVYARELRETLRDRRTLIVMGLFPLVVYPLLALLATQVMVSHASHVTERPSRIAVVGPAALIAPATRALARDTKHFQLSAGDEAALARGELDALVVAAPPAPDTKSPAKLVVQFDSTRDESREAQDRASDVLAAVLPEGCAASYVVSTHDHASARERGGHMLAHALPLIVIVMVMLGAFYPAIDCTAGERERGTLETTLVAPVRRFDLLLGKVLNVATLAALTGALNLASLAFTFIEAAHIADPHAVIPMPWERVALASLVTVPAALFFAALMVAIATTARGFKEGQTLLTPIYILFLAPSLAATLGDVRLSLGMALVPAANLALLGRDLLIAHVAVVPTLVTLAASFVYAGLALGVAARLFDSERLLSISDAEPRVRRGHGALLTPRPTTAADAALLFGVAFVLLVACVPLQQRNLPLGLLVSQLGGMLGLVAVFARFKHRSFADVVGMARPHARALIGALLMGGSAWFAVAFVSQWLVPAPKELLDDMRRAVVGDGGRSLPMNLALIALLPAVCEESLFRGPIMRGLHERFPRASAIVMSATLFGLFHLNLYRLLPTVVLGIMLGWIAFEARSTAVSALAHFVNNAVLVTLGTLGYDDRLERVTTLQTAGLCAISLLIAALGAWLVRSSFRVAPRPKGQRIVV